MFCPNCGNRVADDAAFCGNCGTRLNFQPAPQEAPQTYPEAPQAYAEAPQPYAEAPQTYAPQNEGYIPYAPAEGYVPYPAPEAPKKNNLPKLLGIVAAAVAVVVLLVVLLGGGGGNGNPEAVAEKFFDSVMSGDIDGAKECVHPDMWKEIGGEFEELGGMMAMFGDSVKISVNGSENVTDEEFDDVQEMLDEYGIDDKLGEIYSVEVTMTISLFGMEESDTDDVLVAEIDGNCYIVDAG